MIAKYITCDLCDKSVYARGWCAMHYERWRRHGDPNTVIGNRKKEQTNIPDRTRIKREYRFKCDFCKENLDVGETGIYLWAEKRGGHIACVHAYMNEKDNATS